MHPVNPVFLGVLDDAPNAAQQMRDAQPQNHAQQNFYMQEDIHRRITL
jgi:hypothetical protein